MAERPPPPGGLPAQPGPRSPGAERDRVIAAFRSIRSLPLPPGHTALHDALCAYVDALKGAGEPPQRVVVLVKELAHQHVDHRHDAFAWRELLEGVVHLCVERYFRRGA